MAEEQLAFKDAKGYGKNTTGGRGGAILRVTNLNDSGPGSLRDACEVQTGPRTVIFDISGNIKLESKIIIRHGNISILGHSAPGDGITIEGYSLVILCDEVIIRYIRVRVGYNLEITQDAIQINNAHNVIIDHVSMSWSSDEIISVGESNNVTISNCMICEPLNYAGHGYGSLIRNIHPDIESKVTITGCIYTSCFSRVPRVAGSILVDFVENIIYNCTRTGYSCTDPDIMVNIANNYYKAGPSSGTLGFHAWRFSCENGGKLYIHNNFMHGLEYKSDNNMLMVTDAHLSNEIQNTAPYGNSNIDSRIDLEYVFLDVFDDCGCSYVRDKVDKRLLSEIIENTGGVVSLSDPDEAAIESTVDVINIDDIPNHTLMQLKNF